jgi:hypothetical protein
MRATSATALLSTAMLVNECTSTPIIGCPIHAPISTANSGETRIKIKKDGQMTEQSERLASVRAEIAARVANFKAMQERFQREREEYFVTTLEKARSGSSRKRSWT